MPPGPCPTGRLLCGSRWEAKMNYLTVTNSFLWLGLLLCIAISTPPANA